MSILNRIQTSAIDILAATLIAALVVVAPAPLFAQQNAAPKASVKGAQQAEEENEAPAAKTPGGEGIKVHGHWIIDVHDKDGKLVERRDFHNALYAGTGTSILIASLAGQRVPNSFTILLYDSQSKPYRLYPPTTSTLIPLASKPAACSGGAPACNPNMTTTLHQDANGYYDSIILAGSFTPATAISLTTVRTNANACQTADNTVITVTPAQCAVYTTGSNNILEGDYDFTGTTLSTPLTVAAGQSVSVSVVLSFS